MRRSKQHDDQRVTDGGEDQPGVRGSKELSDDHLAMSPTTVLYVFKM